MPDKPASPGPAPEPFWRKKLAEMSQSEWESLCDGCGRCCLVKLEDEDTEEVYFTSVACRLLDAGTCQCSDYANRQAKVPDCIKLTPELIATISWLPATCGYRLVHEGKDLPWWHPLVSGTPETVHEAGVSVRGRVAGMEDEVAVADLPEYMVTWPMRVPRRARGSVRPKFVKGKISIKGK